MATRRNRPRHIAAPLLSSPLSQDVCLEVEDNGVFRRSAVEFFRLGNSRDPHVQAGRFADQFVEQNRGLMRLLDVTASVDYDGRSVGLSIRTGNNVGSIPLASPTTARHDYGLVVRPRFPWSGIGPMLASMGWRVSPSLLRLPLLHRSERRVPQWVLSSAILPRIAALLDSLERRFETTTSDRNAPRGRVEWARYAVQRLPRAQFLSVPCTYPDLRDDRLIRGAVRYTLEQQIAALELQKEHGRFIHQMVEFARGLLLRVEDAQPLKPSRAVLLAWHTQRPLRTPRFAEGVEAIEWSVEERGLAGMSDLEGIPWRLPMDSFFEAWIEAVMQRVAVRTGAQLRIGRKMETVFPIRWEPPYQGSQKTLLPDVWLQWDSLSVAVDAKYKRHFEELQDTPWVRLEEELRNQHRHDLHQVLAYTTLSAAPKTIGCLVYPCSHERWLSLKARNRLVHRAEVGVARRSVAIWLTAIPMSGEPDTAAEPLAHAINFEKSDI